MMEVMGQDEQTTRVRSRRDIEFLARLGIEEDDLQARTQLGPGGWSKQAAPEVRARVRANSSRRAPAQRPQTATIRTRAW